MGTFIQITPKQGKVAVVLGVFFRIILSIHMTRRIIPLLMNITMPWKPNGYPNFQLQWSNGMCSPWCHGSFSGRTPSKGRIPRQGQHLLRPSRIHLKDSVGGFTTETWNWNPFKHILETMYDSMTNNWCNMINVWISPTKWLMCSIQVWLCMTLY